jgi:uncharacterized protein
VIKVQVRREQAGVAEFRVTGHAGYASHGEDIVCAAVSALVQTALLGLSDVAGQPFQAEVSEGDAWCRLQPGTPDQQVRAQAILETMVLGLKDIAKNYPKFARLVEGG